MCIYQEINLKFKVKVLVTSKLHKYVFDLAPHYVSQKHI